MAQTPVLDLEAVFAEQLEPQSFYGVWQHVEKHCVIFKLGEGSWVSLCNSREAALLVRASDAEENARSEELYTIQSMTLMDAFDEARTVALPIVYPGGSTCYNLAGVVVFGAFQSHLYIEALYQA